MEKKELVVTKVEQKDLITAVEKMIAEFQETGMIHFPEHYSPQNALKSAWLILKETADKDGRCVLDYCTKESIYNALFYTVIQGLSPAKKQVYFYPYGDKLTAVRSYFGTMAVTKRIQGVRDIFSQIIYNDDVFEYTIEEGTKRVITHKQKIENIDITKIKGAYCTIYYTGTDDEDYQYTEIMHYTEIRKSWEKGATKGNSPAHRDTPNEMAKRTVINRTCKTFVNTSDDSDLLILAFNSTEGYSEDEAVEAEVKESANKKVLPGDEEVKEAVEKAKEKEAPKPKAKPNF